MAYKRQTSFSPFTSKRSVSTRESKDQLALAKALESQRKQTVKEFAGASSQQIEELGRIDKIARQKDEYEINELARFSKSLNSAIQTGSKVLGKQYIEGQKEKGAAAFADDPFDPLAVEQELNKLRDTNLELLDEIEKSETEKKILSLEEKIKLHESRMNRGNWGIGYTKAYLQEVGNGFLPHLSSVIADGDGYYEEPELDPLTLEPIEGSGIKFSDYYNQTLETKQKMDQEIFRRYKEKHNLDDINARYLNKYVNEPAAKILNKWAANELSKSIIENAEQEINGFSNDVTTIIGDWTFSEIPEVVTDENAAGYEDYQNYLKIENAIKNNIQHFLNRVPGAMNSRGVPEGLTANSATSDLLRKVLISSIIDIPSEVGRDNLIDAILGKDDGTGGMVFKTKAGNVPLTFFKDFKKTDFESAVATAISDEFIATRTSEQNQLQSDFHNAVMQFKTDEDPLALQEAYYNAVNSEWYYEDTVLGNKIDKMYQSALGGVKQQLTISESIKEATKLKSLYTIIPLRVAIDHNLNSAVIRELQAEGRVAQPGQELWIDTNKEKVGQWQEQIQNAFLTKATGGNSNNKQYILTNAEYIKAAGNLSNEQLISRTEFYFNNAEWREGQKTKDEQELYGLAMEQAFNEIIATIPSFDNEETMNNSFLGDGTGHGSKRFTLKVIEDGKGFTNFKHEGDWVGKYNAEIEDNADKLSKHVTNHFTKDNSEGALSGNILSSYTELDVPAKEAILEGNKVTINGEELYNAFPEFAVKAAYEDATGVSALQIWNAERKTMGLGEITPEMLAPHLQNVAKFENTLTRNDKIDIQQGKVEGVMDRSGLISISYLTNAFKNNFNEGVFKIDPAKVKEYAANLGIEYNFLYKSNGDINPEAEVLWDNIIRHHSNNLIKEATNGVNNKQEALQNFYALASGKSTTAWRDNNSLENKGVEFFADYNSNGASLANYDVAYDIMSDKELDIDLSKFKEFNGKNFKLSELTNNVVDASANRLAELEKETFDRINNEEGFEAAYDFATRNLKINNVEDLKVKLEQLRNDTEGVDFSTRTKQNYTTASYNTYINNINKQQSQINIVSLLSDGQGDINWGLQQSIEGRLQNRNWILDTLFGSGSKIFPPTWTTDYRVVSDIINVIGESEWEDMKQLAADNAGITAPPESFAMKFIPGQIKKGIEEDFVNEMYKLIIMRPEFYIGEFK